MRTTTVLKLLMYLAIVILTKSKVYSQNSDSFVRTYNWITMKMNLEDEWPEATAAKNTYVFNYNNTSDVKCYQSNGKTAMFVRVSKVETNTTTTGIPYQYFTALDNEGTEVVFTLYEDGSLFLIYKIDPPFGIMLF